MAAASRHKLPLVSQHDLPRLAGVWCSGASVSPLTFCPVTMPEPMCTNGAPRLTNFS
jgi:hypothetical protein